MKHVHAEVIKAWADGAEIQYHSQKLSYSKWIDCATPSWHTNVEYRVKPPEPREFWAIINSDSGLPVYITPNKADAFQRLSENSNDEFYRIINLREVLP